MLNELEFTCKQCPVVFKYEDFEKHMQKCEGNKDQSLEQKNIALEKALADERQQRKEVEDKFKAKIASLMQELKLAQEKNQAKQMQDP
jgi:hypothetical protein